MTMAQINLKISKKVFNDVYLPYLNDETGTQLLFGGSSSGKSYFLAQRTVLDVANGGHNYLVTRNVQNTIKKSVFNEITKAISFFKLDGLFNINKSDMVITCANGYQILFCGLDDPEKIKSITPQKGVVTDVWVEEATETEYAAVKQLRKRLRGRSKVQKRLILSFNPILKTHWIFRDYFWDWDDSKREYRDDKLTILKTTYKDNKFLTQQDVEELENETDRYFYEVYTLGNWGVLGNVIFKNWEVQDLTAIRKTFTTANLYNGLDFGFSQDPAAMAHMGYDRKHQTLYIFDELYERELTNDQLAKEIKKIINKQDVICDSAEPKSIKELKNFGVRARAAKKGADSVNFGIDWLQRQKIIIDIRCQNAKNEFQMYRWQEDKDGNVLPKPIDKDNHLIDAIRYGTEPIQERRKLKAAKSLY